MPKHKSEDYKLTAVNYYLTDGSKNQTKTCKIFKCSERSLMRWVNKYSKSKNIKRKTRKYKAYKVSKTHIKFIKNKIKNDKTIPISDLTIKLNDKFKTNLHKSHINRVIKDNLITLKQTRLRHEPKTRFRKPVYINKLLDEFYKNISKYKIDDIICIDETSLNSFEVRKHCYEEIGKRCVIKTNNQDVFKKYTGIFAISSKGCIGYEIYKKGGIDSERLIEFINRYIKGSYRNKVIILDNASSHKSKDVKKLIEKDNKLLYSVVYQHYTNAIENFFSVLKSKLRKDKDIGYDNLVVKIKNILKDIPIKTYVDIFNGSYQRKVKYTRKIIRKEIKEYK